MAENNKNIGNPDRSKNDVKEDYELRDWINKYGVNPDTLKRAIPEDSANTNDIQFPWLYAKRLLGRNKQYD